MTESCRFLEDLCIINNKCSLDDTALYALSLDCPLLNKLSLQGQETFTDSGVYALIGRLGQVGQESGSGVHPPVYDIPPGCPKLTQLLLYTTPVLVEGRGGLSVECIDYIITKVIILTHLALPHYLCEMSFLERLERLGVLHTNNNNNNTATDTHDNKNSNNNTYDMCDNSSNTIHDSTNTSTTDCYDSGCDTSTTTGDSTDTNTASPTRGMDTDLSTPNTDLNTPNQLYTTNILYIYLSFTIHDEYKRASNWYFDHTTESKMIASGQNYDLFSNFKMNGSDLFDIKLKFVKRDTHLLTYMVPPLYDPLSL